MKSKTGTPAATGGRDMVVLALAVLAAVGLAISAYLTTVHYTSVPLICLEGSTGCEEVNRSIYSEVAGVSVALLGAGAYAVLLLTLWTESASILKNQEAVLAQFGVALAGTLYSLYLTYVEVFVIGAICSWCVASAVIITAILALTVVRLRRVMAAESAAPVKGKAGKSK